MPDSSPDIQQVARRLRDLALLARADQARRCVFVKTNGLRCGSPAMRGNPFCFFHDRWYNQPVNDTFPPLQDENSVQLALMQVIERLRRETFRAGGLDPRLVKPLIFALKVAGQNASHTSFDAAGWRSQFVTTLPVARIPDQEAAAAADGSDGARDAGRNGAKHAVRKPPRPTKLAGPVQSHNVGAKEGAV